MQQKSFDLDILDSEAIMVCKFSTELMAYSLKITNIMKKLSDTRKLWVKLNGITKEQAAELDKKRDKAHDKAVMEFEAHLKEVIDG
jgi:Skp family chaperone for outer membrane proteins